MRHLIGILGILVLLVTLGKGQDTALTVQQAVEIGLEENYDIRLAKGEAAIHQNNVTLGHAGFLPEVILTGQQNNNISNTHLEFINGETIDESGAQSRSLDAQTSLQWTLFDGLGMFREYDQLQQLEKQGQQHLKAQVERSVGQIMKTYYKIIQQKQHVQALQNALSVSKERLRIAREKHQVGSGSKLEVMRARVDLNADSSALLQQKTALSQSKAELNRLLARKPEAPFRVTDSLPVQESLQYSDLRETTLQQNSTLQAVQQSKAVARKQVQLLRAQRYPQLNLNMDYNFSGSQSEAGFVSESQTMGFDYGLSLSMPLFRGFNVKRQIENANIRLLQQQTELRSFESSLRTDLNNVFREYQQALRQVQLEQGNVKIARESAEMALEQYELGTITAVELREVQQQQLEAENRLTDARYQAKRAEIELLRLSGELVQEGG